MHVGMFKSARLACGQAPHSVSSPRAAGRASWSRRARKSSKMSFIVKLRYQEQQLAVDEMEGEDAEVGEGQRWW